MHRRLGRTLRATSIAILLLALTGCATTNWSYRLLDWYIGWQVRDYISFDAAQRADFNQRLETLLRWHQGTQLPDYSDWLLELDAMLAAERITEEQWRGQGERVGEFWTVLMQRLQPHAAALLVQLSDAQVAELLDNLEQRSLEQERKYQGMDAEQRRHDRARQMEKNLKRWTGSVSAAQAARIEQWSAEVADLSELSIASRRGWAAAMAAALAERGAADEGSLQQSLQRLEQRLEPLLVDPSRLWSPKYAAAIESNTQRTINLLTDLHALLDAKQHRHLRDSLRGWSERLRQLADNAA